MIREVGENDETFTRSHSFRDRSPGKRPEGSRRRLADDGLSEDDISDLTNDRLYLEAIKRDFETYRDQMVRDRENVGAGL